LGGIKALAIHLWNDLAGYIAFCKYIARPAGFDFVVALGPSNWIPATALQDDLLLG